MKKMSNSIIIRVILNAMLCFMVLLCCVFSARAANDVPDAVLDASKSVVRILSEYSDYMATGSGFIIKNEYGEVLIVTNNHVVEDNPHTISVWVGEDDLEEAEIVFTAAEKDICVLRIYRDLDIAPVKLSTDDPRQGAAIYAVGFPGGADILSDQIAYTSESATITDGIISTIHNFTIVEGAQPVKLLQINAAINRGNSGGPLFNAEGVVIGVNTFGANSTQGIFGAIDIGELWDLLNRYGISIAFEATQPEQVEESLSVFPLILFFSIVIIILVIVASIYAIRGVLKREQFAVNRTDATHNTIPAKILPKESDSPNYDSISLTKRTHTQEDDLDNISITINNSVVRNEKGTTLLSVPNKLGMHAGKNLITQEDDVVSLTANNRVRGSKKTSRDSV